MIILFFFILNLVLFIFTTVHYQDQSDMTSEMNTRDIITLSISSISLILLFALMLLYFIVHHNFIYTAILCSIISGYSTWEFFTRHSLIKERDTTASMISACVIIALLTQIGKTMDDPSSSLTPPSNDVQE